MIISENKDNANVNTKRKILSEISKLYDPLSLTLPVTIQSKILMRDIWALKVEWDENLPYDILKRWKDLSEHLNKLSTLNFNRFYFNSNSSSPIELFIFCDSSQYAYGFVCYALQNGKSNLVFSKSKIAPMKKRSLPTLELLSVFLAFKSLYFILKAYKLIAINNIFIFVDAQVVLSWLLTDLNKLKTKNFFARNRIKDIKNMKSELSDNYSTNFTYKYIQTDQNIADVITRGLSFSKFKENLDYWEHGPEWLNRFPLDFPKYDLKCLTKDNQCIVQNSLLNEISQLEIRPIIKFDRFSDFSKLVGTTALVFKFINKCKKVKQNENLQAKIYLISIMQKQMFAEEFKFLEDPKSMKPPDLVNNLNIFKDKNNLLRVGGRIAKSQSLNFELVYPLLLAKNHPLTSLIIKHSHLKCKHLGISATLNKLRMLGFWLLKGRQSVKNVIKDCFVCRKFNSLCFKYPKLTNLPTSRVNIIKPFTDTGVDFTGTLWVKSENGGSKKMYILLFTCLSVRLIHIELLQDMSTYAFIQALIRFSNLYGIPERVYSDNCRSFCAALNSNIVEHHLNSSEFSNKFQADQIKHIKIPYYSPWIGSTWERMIKTIKSCLYKTIGRAKVNYFDLLTILSDIQLAINSRPLTYRCSSDSTLEIITPNCFLNNEGKSNLVINTNNKGILENGPPTQSDVVLSFKGARGNYSKIQRLVLLRVFA